MGDEIRIEKATFESRVANLQAAWKDRKNDAFNGVTSILSVMGKTEEGPYSKSLALHVSGLSVCWVWRVGRRGQWYLGVGRWECGS